MLYAQPWAMDPDALQAFALALMSTADIEASERLAASGARADAGEIAVLSLHGPVMHRGGLFAEMFGLMTSEIFGKKFRAAMDNPGVRAVVLDVDSPGGAVAGTPELADQIFSARGTKPIYAIANSSAFSAAYYIASAADELSVIPSGQVGSIGVYMMHVDMSAALEHMGIKATIIRAGKYKAEGSRVAPLTDEAREHFQSLVDADYETFLEDVARHRSTTTSNVRRAYGEGRVVSASDALAAGMVDRVETFDQLIERIGGPRAPASRRRRRRAYV